ncbi:hypothetical protein L3V82_10280 [Thiotrichales bacterium 19S3-7]|nr:hypothetical protein [Thiotrichales bacterium 19S3-7]MCF6802543.1 hypothetical protein [Thiotrichales bacterium 19S3-11]
MTNYNQLALKELKANEYSCQVVERWCGFSKRKHDLFGIIDVLAVGNSETLGIQITSRNNIASRIKKIADSDVINDLRKAGWRIEVWGYDKPKHRWRLKRVDIS